MKHFTTKFLAVCAFLAVVGSVQAQVFYQQLFDGPGLPAGWTTTDPSGNNVLWARCTNVTTDCHADLGYDAFAGADKANGFMVVDSDGAGDLGSGITHQSRLNSAAIDCSGKPQVYAVFEHQIGVFDYDADENAQLFVSNNGTTWTAFQLFEGLEGGQGDFSDNPTVSGIDISAVAGNQATVYLRWEWIGNYEYWWTLDDVRLTTIDPSPANDLAVNDFYYPVHSYATPESQVAIDTFDFEAYISNNGLAEQTNVKVYAYVQEHDPNTGAFISVLFTDSITIASLAPGVVDSTFTLPNRFVPDLPAGLYAVTYEVVSDAVEQVPSDNFEGDFFEITDLVFAKENGPQTASRPQDGGDWAVGNYYRMGPLGASLEQYVAVGAEFAYAVDPPQVPGDINVEISLYRINDDVDEFFSNFEPDGSSMELVGLSGLDAPDGTENFELLSTELTDLGSGLPGVLLDPNGRYILAAGYTGESATAFAAFNDNVRADFVSTVTYIGGDWNLGGFVGSPNAVLRMYIDLATSTDDNPLAETALNVSPNPTAEFVNLKVKFDEPTNATITIADINGRVIRTENRSAMLDETVTYQMPQLASGTYLARIATAKGTRTLKFVVQK